MGNFLRSALCTLGIIGFISIAHAEDSKSQTQSSEHHATETPKAESHEMMKDHEHMKGMMHECKEKHKDGEMCNHDMMAKCQEKMGKEECSKMMKTMKSGKKTK